VTGNGDMTQASEGCSIAYDMVSEIEEEEGGAGKAALVGADAFNLL
jgi:hypothetical protein